MKFSKHWRYKREKLYLKKRNEIKSSLLKNKNKNSMIRWMRRMGRDSSSMQLN